MSKSSIYLSTLSPIALALVLSACGGSSDADFGGNAGSSSSGTGNGTGTGTGTEEELVYSLQALEVGLTNLSAGGSTGMTTRLVDQNGDFAKESFDVSFTSACISNGASEINSPVTSSNGVFTATYTAKGCEGDDTVTASVDGLSVEATVNVQAANLGAVEFISASPQNILLKGMSASGQQHTSTVIFQIKNDVGGPITNEDVTFSLSTDVGGIQLASAVGKTDNQGFVSTILQSGTVHTNVRVKATVNRGGVEISSESSQLVISTGVADQNSLSLSLSELNPSAWNHDGVQVSVNLYASDRYNNPVPDGTTVAFYTELGQIEPSCQTINGACVVTWTSTDPRDLGTLNTDYPRHSVTNYSDGISTITAVVIGEESFIDSNSNGVFDDGDELLATSDKGDAFENYNRGYNSSSDDVEGWNDGLEPFLDFNGNGIRDVRDGLYTGLGCTHSTLCAAGNGLKNIFTSAELVMAEDNQNIIIWEGGIGGTPVTTIKNNVQYTMEIGGVQNNQVPPIGTTISTSSDEADVVIGSADVLSTNQHTNDLTSPAGLYTVPLLVTDADPEEQTNGYIKVTITTPRGAAVTHFFTYEDDILDITAPVIMVNGNNPETVALNANYVDAGATATDNIDGLVAVITSGIVDTATPGDYTITYTATDSSGNQSVETRSVTVTP